MMFKYQVTAVDWNTNQILSRFLDYSVSPNTGKGKSDRTTSYFYLIHSVPFGIISSSWPLNCPDNSHGKERQITLDS